MEASNSLLVRLQGMLDVDRVAKTNLTWYI